ncbi:MAG TPA: hypothetical protein VM345_13040 [Acidimicrobiales bacterium]|nr:hypothetical protein [Acidimicrobiales bacterium]
MAAEAQKPLGRSLVAASMLGLAQVLEGNEREELPIIETSVGGDGDPIDLVLDPDDPRLTVAFVRPWLRHRRT